MHKLMEYVCEELEKLEKKAGKNGELSMAETEYMGELLDAKKDLMKIDEMEGGSSFARGNSYRYDGMSYDDMSYARGDGRGRGRNARRDSMGRYSSERGYSRDDELMSEIEMLPEHKKNELRRMIKEM